MCFQLKDRLRHIKNFKHLFEQKLIRMGQSQTGSGQELSIHMRERLILEKRKKQSKEIVDVLQPKAYLAVCDPWSIDFDFIDPFTLIHLQACLLPIQAYMAVEPPQSDCLPVLFNKSKTKLLRAKIVILLFCFLSNFCFIFPYFLWII